MPRHVITSPPRSTRHEALVKKLVHEFASSSPNVQPLILEEEIPATRSKHVRVIWDQWQGVEDEERSAIIADAYAIAEGQGAANAITIADGLTPAEAHALGLLPFKVVPARKKDQPLPGDAYAQALAKEARRTLLGRKSKDLRYARVEDAQEAVKRLEKLLPHSSWSVIQEVAMES